MCPVYNMWQYFRYQLTDFCELTLNIKPQQTLPLPVMKKTNVEIVKIYVITTLLTLTVGCSSFIWRTALEELSDFKWTILVMNNSKILTVKDQQKSSNLSTLADDSLQLDLAITSYFRCKFISTASCTDKPTI
jgi:hypothetical protein